MRTKKILTAVMAIVMMSALFLTACGSKTTTLESYVNDNSDVREQLDKALGSAEDQGVKVDIQGNDIIYTFALASLDGITEEIAKSDEIKSAFEEAMDGQADAFKSVASQMVEATGIEGIRVIVNYTYEDEVVATGTFEADSN